MSNSSRSMIVSSVAAATKTGVAVLTAVALVSAFALPVSAAAQPDGAFIGLLESKKPTCSMPQVSFVANEGQLDSEVKYYARTFAGDVFVTETGQIVYSFVKGNRTKSSSVLAIREEIRGGLAPEIVGRDRIDATSSSFRGSDPGSWAGGAANYRSVDMGEVYEGISLVLKASGKNVEKLFFVDPGADPDDILMSFEGAEMLTLSTSGELVLNTELGEVSFTGPVAYQVIGGGRQHVEVAYKISDSDYGFSVGEYDTTVPLVIDPLLASTFVGGSGTEGWQYSGGVQTALDADGNLYVAGTTASTDFPLTSGVYDCTSCSGEDFFIFKIDPDLTTLLASVVIGGAVNEVMPGLSIGPDGSIYLAGATPSSNFPTTYGALDRSHGGQNDLVIMRFDPDLTVLMSSTFLGGNGNEYFPSISVDTSGNVFVGGITSWGATNSFPTTVGAYDRTYSPNYPDFFVSKLTADLSTLTASTLLGGTYEESWPSIALDPSGNVIITGATESDNYPSTSGAYDENFHGTPQPGAYRHDQVVSKISSDLSTLMASTYIGSELFDGGGAIAMDYEGNVFVGGHSESPDYPVTSGAYDENHNGENEFYITKLNNDLTGILASTYLTADDETFTYVTGLTCDSAGDLYMTGAVWGGEMNVTPWAYDTSFNGGANDIFVRKLSGDLTTLRYSTYLGGGLDEGDGRVAVGADGSVFVAGYTQSHDFPTTAGTYSPLFNGGTKDAFVARFAVDRFTRVTDGPHVTDGGHSWSVSWIDYDADGYLDLFVSNLDIDNGLYRNDGDGSFTKMLGEDLTANSHGIASAGVSWGDFNNDGYPDVFIATFREGAPPVNMAFINNGGGSFTQITGSAMVSDAGMAIEPSWVDYDNDGFLDLYVANHHDMTAGTDGSNFLYHQDDTGFSKITGGAVVTDSAGSNSVSWADYDNDGDQDLFVANGWVNPNDGLYENNGDGSFSMVASGSPTGSDGVSWGGSWGDYDNDGYLDLFVTQSVWNSPGVSYDSLFRNNGDGTFSTPIGTAPNENGGYSAGSTWGDFDNDGDLDLYVAVDGPNLFYENLGAGSFARVIVGDLVTDSFSSMGCASGDYDRDGDLDLFVTNIQQNNNLYRNNGNANNWIVIHCIGTVSNRSAIGAKVRLKATIGASSIWQTREISSKTGKCGQNSLDVHFGLGDAESIDTIMVEWPSGVVQTLTDVGINQLLIIEEVCCIPPTVGDIDQSGGVDITDISVLIDNQFLTLTPLVCEDEGDVDFSGLVDITDLSILIDNQFLTLTPLPPCP